jgi:UDP-N-acetylmuramyl tripeptide synthase
MLSGRPGEALGPGEEALAMARAVGDAAVELSALGTLGPARGMAGDRAGGIALLREARELAAGRVICVFGAGGDRDREKRPLMGRVAAELADEAIVTSDNPRTEDPAAIAAEIVDGFDLNVELDRSAAIERAIGGARSGDVVVIAGKGHERGQAFGDRTLPFDDRDVARDALRRLGTPA